MAKTPGFYWESGRVIERRMIYRPELGLVH